MLEHMTTATAIAGLIGLGVGTSFGVVVAGFLGSGRAADLRDTLAAREALIEAKDRRIIRTEAENLRLRPHAEAHLASVKQREAALAKAQAANRERAKAGNVTPITTPKGA